MHLQFAPTGAIDDGREARDLAQPPAEIVILSAADTELGALARAAADRSAAAPGIALTNFLQLGHPMSVDLYVERTLARARACPAWFWPYWERTGLGFTCIWWRAWASGAGSCPRP